MLHRQLIQLARTRADINETLLGCLAPDYVQSNIHRFGDVVGKHTTEIGTRPNINTMILLTANNLSPYAGNEDNYNMNYTGSLQNGDSDRIGQGRINPAEWRRENSQELRNSDSEQEETTAPQDAKTIRHRPRAKNQERGDYEAQALQQKESVEVETESTTELQHNIYYVENSPSFINGLEDFFKHSAHLPAQERQHLFTQHMKAHQKRPPPQRIPPEVWSGLSSVADLEQYLQTQTRRYQLFREAGEVLPIPEELRTKTVPQLFA